MNARPILFSAAMVRALLSGSKSQTRRIVKWPEWVKDHDAAALGLGGRWPAIGLFSDGRPVKKFTCPYGEPGDELWVRETWQPLWAGDLCPPQGLTSADGWQISYPATGGLQEWHDEDEGKISLACKPSIHMPRWASRITLRVTSVRVERLHAISEADAMAEGVEDADANENVGIGRSLALDTRFRNYDTSDPTNTYCVTARESYASLWETINGAGSWAANPWVWCVGFEVCR